MTEHSQTCRSHKRQPRRDTPKIQTPKLWHRLKRIKSGETDGNNMRCGLPNVWSRAAAKSVCFVGAAATPMKTLNMHESRQRRKPRPCLKLTPVEVDCRVVRRVTLRQTTRAHRLHRKVAARQHRAHRVLNRRTTHHVFERRLSYAESCGRQGMVRESTHGCSRSLNAWGSPLSQPFGTSPPRRQNALPATQ